MILLSLCLKSHAKLTHLCTTGLKGLKPAMMIAKIRKRYQEDRTNKEEIPPGNFKKDSETG
jgi:hypothetical protein